MAFGAVPFSASATLSARDENGTYTTSLSVAVADAASFSLAIGSVSEGSTAVLATTFTDPGGSTPTSYVVHWGDGNSNTYGLTPDLYGTFDHVYTMGGTYSATATATTPNGTYTAYGSAAVDVIDPNSGVLDNGAAAVGQPYPLAYFYQFDEVGNLDPSFPVANHPTTYKVNWGDGATNTYTAPDFSHDYTATTGPSLDTYSVTATNSEYTSVYVSTVEVFPSLSASLAINAPTSGTEGTDVTTTISFTDSAQTTDPGTPAIYIYWGDGTTDLLTPDEGDPNLTTCTTQHSYSEPGTYQMTFAAGYFEAGTQSAVYNTLQSVTIAQHVPTLTTTESTSSTVVGDDITLYPTYTDSVGDHRPHDYTITWGDGSSDEYDGYNMDPPNPVHDYATAGTYHPTISVTAFALTGSASITASAVTVHNPTVTISAGTGTATEDGQVADAFTITRSDGDAFPLTVSYTLGGTALSSEYIIVDDATGKILSGTATIPAGTLNEIVDIVPLEDNTPRWTDTLDMTLTSGSGYSLGSGATFAETEIVNDDLSVVLGDGSDDIFLNGSATGETSLIPVVMDFPTETLTGAEVTLSMPDTDETLVNIWDTDSPTDSTTAILGDVNGTYVDSVVWTYGVSGHEPPTEQTYWMGGTGGSVSLGDIHLSLNDDDSNATRSPSPPPASPPPPSPPPTTTVSATTNPVSGTILYITMLTDPNSSGDIGNSISGTTNNTHNWLPGQVVRLDADVHNILWTAATKPALTYQWDIPGTVLYDYKDSDSSATQTDLLPDNGVNNTVHVGTSQEYVQYFWVTTTDNSEDVDTVSVHVTGAGVNTTAKTTFDVYEPTSTFGATKTGTTVVVPATFAKVVALEAVPGQQGVQITGNVQMPAAVNSVQGSWKGVQLVTPYVERTIEIGGVEQLEDGSVAGTVFNGLEALDGADPNLYWSPSSPASRIFPTGAAVTRTLLDEPAAELGTVDDRANFPSEAFGTVTHLSIHDQFQDYLMFLPPGSNEVWVPLQYLVWHWDVELKRSDDGNGRYTGPSSGPEPTEAEVWDAEPLWQHVLPVNSIGYAIVT